ncbi:MAG: mechanosensitive ion channel family protein [Leptospirillia bacterium]
MQGILEQLATWFQTNVFTLDTLAQAGWVAVALVAGYVLSRAPIRWIEGWRQAAERPDWVIRLLHALCDALLPAIALLFLLLHAPVARWLEVDARATAAAATLCLAWIAIRFLSALIKRPTVARPIAFLLWGLAALHVSGLLLHLIDALDSVAFSLGGGRISLLTVLTGVAVVALLIFGANALTRLIEKQLTQVPGMSPSLQVLTGKLIHIALVVLALLIGLNTMGIDLTALTVFGGALGVGLGFGLQKVVSNLISGIILLADRSIKPGDVIVVGETYGWVKHLSARYVSLITRDGKEHLIPNELLITERVENWSYSDNNVRMRIPIGIAYDSDPRRAIELIKEAAHECPRALKVPTPNCLVTGFGESSVDLELRLWINDPVEGMGNVRSDVLLRVWDKFAENNIQIPFPQRDLHIRSAPPGFDLTAVTPVAPDPTPKQARDKPASP